MWRTDGTAAGTVQLTADGSRTLTPDGRGGVFYFSSDLAGMHLWHLSADAPAATELATVNAHPRPGVPLAGRAAVGADGTLYFTAPDGPTGAVADVWRSNGTPAVLLPPTTTTDGTFVVRYTDPSGFEWSMDGPKMMVFAARPAGGRLRRPSISPAVPCRCRRPPRRWTTAGGRSWPPTTRPCGSTRPTR